MSIKNIFINCNYLYGEFQVLFLEVRFRKIVYQTDDWTINIKPLFVKEIKALCSKIFFP